MRYSLTVKFTILKCASQWFLVCSQSCATIIITNSHFHHPKEKPRTHSPHSPSPLFPQRLAAILVSRLWICLFWVYMGSHNMWPFSLASLTQHNVFLVHPCDVSVVHFFLWLSALLGYGRMTFCVSIHRPRAICFHFLAVMILLLCAVRYRVCVTGHCVSSVGKRLLNFLSIFKLGSFHFVVELQGRRVAATSPSRPLSWWPFKQPPLYCRPALDHNGVCLRRDNGPLLGVALLVHEWY